MIDATPLASEQITKPAGPDRIYLQPECGVDWSDNGRQWCEDDVWEECGEPGCKCKAVVYVREDLAALSATPAPSGATDPAILLWEAEVAKLDGLADAVTRSRIAGINLAARLCAPSDQGASQAQGEVFVIRRNGAFFRPNAQGYTNHVIAAGFYSREEADSYANVEGVTIEPLSRYRDDAQRTIAEAQRLLAALSPAPGATGQDGAVVENEFTATPPTINETASDFTQATPTIPAGMAAWNGGGSAPEDWNGGLVVLRDGRLFTPDNDLSWQRGGELMPPSGDIIAYTPLAAAPKQAEPQGVEANLRERAIEIVQAEAREMGFCEDDVAQMSEPDGDDLLAVQAVERALAALNAPTGAAAPTPQAPVGQEVERDELATTLDVYLAAYKNAPDEYQVTEDDDLLTFGVLRRILASLNPTTGAGETEGRK